MSSWEADCSTALVWLGVVVVVLAAWGAVLVRGAVLMRLHFLAPVTSLGIPLLAVGLSLRSSRFSGAEMLLTAGLSALAGPILAAATGRLAAQQTRLLDPVGPQ
jgi:multicomponent Na+:H+ antiporter subunit G